ncbi:Glycosyltransferase family 1 protein [Rhodovastum atsumiense]|uniref:Glycosyltransferase family 1 protein n=1 Tax=Rhodovastum atsumiense TaxID=504468 RepID=A0A5M6IRI6_9PROT|nr:nucleotide disphospho-sugar-binding domain-containing protein [Rhodovastum atsumiense]KAA5610920.1 glycosyltransferase family 1 protein [Rhodovastum atsumiense]CAH2601511.1 Glycosyltransferase family 1 protein [Rhodovastum atsumiense]
MTHVVLIAPPYVGHITPMLAISAALAARGAQVTFLHDFDLPAPPPGVATLRVTPAPAREVPFSPLPAVRGTATRTAALADPLLAALRLLAPDVVAVDQLEPAGALAAATLGLPWVSVANALAINREPGVPPPFTAWRWRDSRFGRWRNHGGWRVHDLLMHPLDTVIARRAAAAGLEMRGIDDTLSPFAQVSQLVAGLDFPRRALPDGFHYVGPIRAPEPAPAWPPGGGRRLVFASLGTLQGHRAGIFRAIAAACAGLGLELVIAHGGRLPAEAIATLPGTPQVHNFVPQRAVLARAAALVGHGGMNTVMDAMAAGVPAVILPLAYEQGAIAARLERAGAGIALHGPFDRARRLRAALAAVTGDPRFRTAAATLQRECTAAGGAERAAEIILRTPGAASRVAA